MALPGLHCLLILPGRVVALLGCLNLAHIGTALRPGCCTPTSGPHTHLEGARLQPCCAPRLTSFSLLSQGFWALRKPSSAARLSRKPPNTGRWKAPRCQTRTCSLSGPCSFSRTSRCSSLSRSAAVKKACQAFSSVPYWGPVKVTSPVSHRSHWVLPRCPQCKGNSAVTSYPLNVHSVS